MQELARDCSAVQAKATSSQGFMTHYKDLDLSGFDAIDTVQAHSVFFSS